MASVAVSNGRDVVLTDGAGRYSLPGWHKMSFITVTGPTGYWASDYYIPVSDEKDGYDFYLDKLENDLTDHTFLQVTDSEVNADGAGKIHYIVTPIVHGDVKAKYTDKDVLTFVENDLKNVPPDKKVIMFNHNYCASDETGFVLSEGSDKIDLKEHNLLAWVFGHWHYNYLNEIGGIFNITTSRPDTGGIDASPATIRSVVVEGDRISASKCHYNDFTETTPAGNCAWSVSLGGNILYSSPAVKDGVVYVGTVDDGWPKDCAVTALHTGTGEILWKYRTKNSVKSDICVIGGKIITQDTEGNVYCLDPSGNLIWTVRTKLPGPNNSSSSIAVNETHVYCGGQASSRFTA